jgi:hypothetical protein
LGKHSEPELIFGFKISFAHAYRAEMQAFKSGGYNRRDLERGASTIFS